MNTVHTCNRLSLLPRNINIQLRRHKNKSTAEYCLESVKKYDYENFICSMLLPNLQRSCALAVRSFNVEVARVAEQVSQENIGLMRLKFWEDTLDKSLSNDINTVPKHPVAFELFKANSKTQLTKRYFTNLIASRRQYFKLRGFDTLEEMERYADQSVSNVFYLILEGCGVKNINADHAVSHLGKAQGIVLQLRSIPHSRQLSFVPIPQNILIKNKVSQEEVLRGKLSERLNDCTFEVATRAHQHLLKARSLLESVPDDARAAMLPAVPVHIYLDRLQRVNYDVFHQSLKHRSWKLIPQLWITNIRNKY